MHVLLSTAVPSVGPPALTVLPVWLDQQLTILWHRGVRAFSWPAVLKGAAPEVPRRTYSPSDAPDAFCTHMPGAVVGASTQHDQPEDTGSLPRLHLSLLLQWKLMCSLLLPLPAVVLSLPVIMGQDRPCT